MITALDTYLGWETPEHARGCRRPSWDVGFRTEERAYRHTYQGQPPLNHGCTEEECWHGNTYTKIVVRIVCLSCGVARLVDVESNEETGVSTSSSKLLGYGLPPQQAADLLLWPTKPWLDVGRGATGEPYDFVVTRPKVKKVTAESVVGQLTLGRGKRGGILWTALAVPHPEGRYGWGKNVRFAYANDGRDQGGGQLRTVNAAARWVGARMAEAGAR